MEIGGAAASAAGSRSKRGWRFARRIVAVPSTKLGHPTVDTMVGADYKQPASTRGFFIGCVGKDHGSDAHRFAGWRASADRYRLDAVRSVRAVPGAVRGGEPAAVLAVSAAARAAKGGDRGRARRGRADDGAGGREAGGLREAAGGGARAGERGGAQGAARGSCA